MDYRTQARLLVFHLTLLIPSLGGDYVWRNGEQRDDSKVASILFDVASPRRLAAQRTSSGTSPMLEQYLRYTDKQDSLDEIRYNLSAFGKDYTLILKRENRFLSAALTVEHFSANQSITIPCGANLTHCYYRGVVHGDPVSSAVFDLCYGMRGVFQTRDGVFLVQPLVKNTTAQLIDHNPREELRHLIVNHLAASQMSSSSHCGLDDENVTQSNSSRQHTESSNVTHSRKKRETIFQGVQSYPRYVEMMITADKSMLDHYGSEFELKRYLQTVVGVVHDIFRNPNLGNSIEIVLIGIKILKNDNDLDISGDAKTVLARFRKWQQGQNVKSDADPGHYDTAVLITRKDVCRSKNSCETLGLAELGTMCNPNRSCSIVEDNGLGVAFTIAHEIGHTFNIGHDVKAKKCLGKRNGLHVMAPSLNLQSVPWSWSTCSREAITDFLDQGRDNCLLDKPQYQFKRSKKLPGEIYTPDMQCRLTFGKNSKLCSFKTLPCRRLWCGVAFSSGSERCRTLGMPWAEGSHCGNGMWCVRGSCKPIEVQRKINGAWSSWSPFAPCSRTCGGGVSYSSRACSNPEPSFGGEFCIGAKKRFKSCQTQNCPEGSQPFRAVQCSSFNGKRGSPGTKWLPQYVPEKYPCQLICAGGGDVITAKIIDGTKCDEKKFDICVNGICRLAGCDNVLNSNKKLDECGVCGGDNSTCERITKTWYRKVRWGYNDVATFYPGYSSIRIYQTTPETEAKRRRINDGKDGDDNYLVLRDENYGNILNTGFFIKSMDNLVFEAIGLQITYSGSNGYPEYIKIKGELTQKIYLQVLAVQEVIAPKITYSFIHVVKQTFSWDNKGSWSRCSRECRGWRRRKLVCKRQDGLVVASKRCDAKEVPETIKQSCHTHCIFKWMVAGKGACKPGCGRGVQKVFFKCVKHHLEAGANLVRSNKDCKHITKPQSERPCMGTCDNFQWVYSKWSTCSKTCGGGTQTRKVTCVEKVNNVRKEKPSSMCSRIRIRHLERTCNTDQCPTWSTSRWDRCSASCGEGFQRRRVSCVLKGKEIQQSACNLKEKPNDKEACQMKACPHWEYDEWSDCSVSCGTGDKIRVVHCVDADGKRLTDKDCSGVKKPVTRQKCSGLPDCDKTVFFRSNVKKPNGDLKWVPGDWGECSARCGPGHQERHVRCLDSKNIVLHNKQCGNITKPPTTQSCAHYCGTWRYSDWTVCSTRCGKGTQRRQVKCFNKYYRLTEDAMCDPLLRPPKTRQCTNYLCSPPKKVKPKISGRWKTGSWNKCSRTCANGFKRRAVICVNEHSKRDETEKSCKRTEKPESLMACNLGKCPEWRIRPWSKCSKTCDLGVVTRTVYCTDQRRILSDDKCNMKLKPTVRKSCSAKRCVTPARWTKGEWRPCSVKCGRGVKRRHVWCESYDRKRIPSVHCRGLKRRPKSVKECRRNTCGVWETGPWGTCSSKCDVGEQVRSVRCRRTSMFLEHEYCVRKNKPLDRKPCRVKSCTSDHSQYKWFTTDWGKCSKTCGTGVKSRMVICTNQHEERALRSKCNPVAEPPDKEVCKNKECSPDWSVGDWSECSRSCDYGIQLRTVTCPVKDYRNVDLCDASKKPSTKRRCNRGLCDGRYVWKTGPWSKCPVSCGDATMRRAVKCISHNNHITSDYKCTQTRSIKPDDNKICKLSPCRPRSCADIQKQDGKQQDKEFILTINDKKIKVYCHGMLTDEPKEYITLAAGSEKNFAEYYHRSLKNPNECPFNGARREDCPQCHAEIFPSSGGAYFSKVRLDISRMALIGNDFTFATTRGNHSPAFGTAGDCYSKIQCPQGRFSVDLRGTGLSLAADVSWQSYGYHLSKVVDIQRGRQIVSGMCGGYCGICRPYRSLRVTL